jgi:hypothetical protein
MTEVSLKCSCGTVQGAANNITPASGTRIVCYCDDCQAFAAYLSQTSEIVDAYGGTDIFQITPSQIKISEGADQIRCIRLGPKGMFRWYTECCQTPIGNTLGSGAPFVGVIHNFMDDTDSRDQNLGPILGHIHVKFAKESLPDQLKSFGSLTRIIIRTLLKLLVWKLKGLNKPSPFFDAHGAPVSEPRILESKFGN